MIKKDKKVVIQLKGGLGNQMFQYAFGSVIAKRNKTKLSLDKTFFSKEHQQNYHAIRSFDLDIFNLDYNVYESKKLNFIVNKIKVLLTKIGVVGYKKYKELSFEFLKDSLEIKKPVYISGYFQSFKYFENYENYLNKIFSFPITKLDDKNTKYLQIIKSTNSISVHIRRGDYVTNSSANVVHGLCDLDYYIKSIETILKNKTTDDLTFFFFSDDIAWVKSKFDYLDHKKIFVDGNKGEDSWKDMCLMSFCKHNIIANSSFSFWGAWLNTNPHKIVIAPKVWFADKELNKKTGDLCPVEWVKL